MKVTADVQKPRDGYRFIRGFDRRVAHRLIHFNEFHKSQTTGFGAGYYLNFAIDLPPERIGVVPVCLVVLLVADRKGTIPNKIGPRWDSDEVFKPFYLLRFWPVDQVIR